MSAVVDHAADHALPGLTRPRAVVFDWDNTLIDSWHAIQDAQNHTLDGIRPAAVDAGGDAAAGARLDARLLPGAVRRSLARGGRGVLPPFRRTAHADAAAAAGRRGDAARHWPSGASTWRCAATRRATICAQEAEHLGWERLLRADRRRFRCGARQAGRRSGAAGARRLGNRPGPDVWFAGDADIDLECAVNAGCVPVLVREQPPVRRRVRISPAGACMSMAA